MSSLRTGPHDRWAWYGLPVLLAVLVAFPVVSAAPTPELRAHPTPGGPHLTTAAVTTPASGRTHVHGSGETLAGFVSAGEQFVNAALLATAQSRGALRSPTIANQGLSASAHAAPVGLAGSGTVRGTVLDSIFGTPVANVTVSVHSITGFGCLPTPCQGLTDRFGAFSVAAPVGGDEVDFTGATYLQNRTWATVANGSTVSVGTVFLVHDGYAIGVLEGNVPGTPPLGGITLNASSRDGLVVVDPGTLTLLNGSFRIAVPPLPSVVSFAPGGGFLANQSFVNVTPYGVASVGTVYLEGGVNVTAHLFDAITGKRIAPSTPSQLVVCSRRDGITCPVPPAAEVGPNVSAYGLAGPASVQAFALGYVVNQSPIRDLTARPLGQVEDIGRINLMPMGAAEISTNLTGQGLLPTLWPTGQVAAVVCTLGSVLVAEPNGNSLAGRPCWSYVVGTSYAGNHYALDTTVTILGAPSQDVIFLEPEGFTFPVDVRSLGGAPNYYPQSAANVTWANLTPDRVTTLGSVDLTPGTYLSGNISVPGGNGSAPGALSVQVCSTDESTVCAPASNVGAAGAPSGCPGGNLSFCAQAPPGPDELVVTSYGIGSNRTWVDVPNRCCGQDGHPTFVGTINVSGALPEGLVNGSIWSAPGPGGIPAAPLTNRFASVEACLVGPVQSGFLGSVCNTAGANLTDGTFSLSTLVGWNRVSVIATGYVANWSWIDVTGRNSTGPLYLAADAQFAGRVITTTGSGVYAAEIKACPLATLLLCRYVGDGTTATDGQYNGTVRGSPFPSGVYQVEASASGYVTNWTWANASAGVLTLVPPIRLSALGNNASGAPAGPGRVARTAAAPTGTWLDGRLVDRATGAGLPGALLSACLVTGGTCLILPDTTGYGGSFNTSVPAGSYHLFLNASDHGNGSVFVNATGASYLHLGTVLATPHPFVRGRVLLGPWPSATVGYGLGPVGAIVSVCLNSTAICGTPGAVSTGGFFNSSAPPGPNDIARLVGTGPGVFGSANAGFDPISTPVNASTPFVDLSAIPRPSLVLDLFGAVTGNLRDGSAWAGTPKTPSYPVRFGDLSAATNGPTNGIAVAQLGGGGAFAVFEPGDGTSTRLVGGGTAFVGANATVPGPVSPSNWTSAVNLTLPHYGWVNAEVSGGVNSSAVPFATVTAILPDPANRTTILSVGTSNGAGWVNLTAPPASVETVQVIAFGFANLTRSLAVGESLTTSLGVLNLSSSAAAGGAWVQSEEVNTVGTPPFSTVVDGFTQRPVADAHVVITSGSGASAPDLMTNDLGQFLLLAPADPFSTLTVQAPAYSEYLSTFKLTNGERLVLPRLNLTGDSVIAGRVVVEPSNTPAVNVAVTACPVGVPSCVSQTQTNGNGWYWIDVPAGLTTVSVGTQQYLANVTATVQASSDRWVGVPPIPVYSLGTIHGVVYALPSGLTITGANVSLCSSFGVRFGGCFESVPSDANGSFQLFAPAGNYLIKASAPEYNDSIVAVGVSPGGSVDVGNVFLESFGVLAGTVVNASSGVPIPYPLLTACAAYVGGACAKPTNGDRNGTFQFLAPPGPVNLDVLASGYLDNFTLVVVPSGGTLQLSDVRLTPIAAQRSVDVTGRVVEAESPSTGLPGAFVGLFQGGTPVVSTSTSTTGDFQLVVDQGSYTLRASGGGRHPYAAPIDLTGPLSGIVLRLANMTYTVSGEVTDGITHLAIGGAQISEGATSLNVTGPSGRYALELENGTHFLTASAAGYGTLGFSISVNGRSSPHDLVLTPLGVRLVVEVVSQATGLPVGQADVLVTTADSVRTLGQGTTDAGGNYSTYLAPGSVLITVTAPGYGLQSATVTLQGASAFVPIDLAPVRGATTSPLSLGSDAAVEWTLGAVVVVGIAVAVVLFRRRSPPEGPPTEVRWSDVTSVDEPDRTGLGGGGPDPPTG